MTDVTTRDKLVKLVVQHLGCKLDQVTDSSNFMDDLGADSLDVIEIVMLVEEKFMIEIPDDVADKCRTFGDFNVYITERLNTGG